MCYSYQKNCSDAEYAEIFPKPTDVSELIIKYKAAKYKWIGEGPSTMLSSRQ